MNIKLNGLAIILLFGLVACSDNGAFQISKNDAESGRGSSGFDFFESFGANEGPFKSLGGPIGNYGTQITFYVTVHEKKIEKTYTPEDDSVAYAADYYLNKSGDGFAVIHRVYKK